MQGNILTFSTETNTGIITGAGNKRYTFTADDWKEKCPVISRVNVDFVAIEDRATEIYCTDVEALQDQLRKIESAKAIELEKLERSRHLEAKKLSDIESTKEKLSLHKEFKEKYFGFYKSSDNKIFKGVIGGLAHKIDSPSLTYLLRLTPFITLFFALGKHATEPEASNFLLFLVALFPAFYLYAAKYWRAVETKTELSDSYLKSKQEDARKLLKRLSNITTKKTKCTHCDSINHHPIENSKIIGRERLTSTETKDQISQHKDKDGKVYSTTTTPVQHIINRVRERVLVTYKCTECGGLFTEEQTNIRDA